MHALLLVGVGLWCFVVAVAGGLAGLVLGNIRLPVLLFAAAAPAVAGGANIAVSGLAAAAAAQGHVRAGRVDWRLVRWMLPPSVAGAVAGGLAASYVPANALRIVTNLVVGVAVGAAGLIGHLPGGIDWTLLAVGAAGSVPGALLGARLTGRLSTRGLLLAVGTILLVAGAAAILQGVV